MKGYQQYKQQFQLGVAVVGAVMMGLLCLLLGICTPLQGTVDLVNRQAQVTVNGGEAATCTFVNQPMGGITVGIFADSNLNGVRNPSLGEGWLNGWRFTLYDVAGQLVGEPVISSGTGIPMGGPALSKCYWVSTPSVRI